MIWFQSSSYATYIVSGHYIVCDIDFNKSLNSNISDI